MKPPYMSAWPRGSLQRMAHPLRGRVLHGSSPTIADRDSGRVRAPLDDNPEGLARRVIVPVRYVSMTQAPEVGRHHLRVLPRSAALPSRVTLLESGT